MRKIPALALGLVSIAARTTVAATPVDRIAFDSCYIEIGEEVLTYCDIWVAGPDGGTGLFLVSDAVEPTWSPDGSRIAYRQFRQGLGIFMLDPADWTVTRLTDGGYDPAWSPDGSQIAYVADGDLYLANVDGSGIVRLMAGRVLGRPAWSPDGGRVAYDCLMEPYNLDVCAIGADGSGFVRLTDDPAAPPLAAVSEISSVM